MMFKIQRSCGHGFTLIELLVTLSVLSLLSLFAVPSFKSMIQNNRLTAQTDNFVEALNVARINALNQAINTQVCPFAADNSTACGTNWSAGWIVATQPATGVATLLQSHKSSTIDPTLTASVAKIVFDPHGLATTPGNFTFCDSRGGSYAQSVEVLATGFVQAGDIPGKAVWDNSALQCA